MMEMYFDTIMLATRAALIRTGIPKIIVEDMPDGSKEFDVLDDMSDGDPVKGAEELPVSITCYLVGNTFILDASLSEEICTTAKVTIAVGRDGRLCGVAKSATGSIPPTILMDMFQVSVTVCKDMIQALGDSLTSKISHNNTHIISKNLYIPQ